MWNEWPMAFSEYGRWRLVRMGTFITMVIAGMFVGTPRSTTQTTYWLFTISTIMTHYLTIGTSHCLQCCCTSSFVRTFTIVMITWRPDTCPNMFTTHTHECSTLTPFMTCPRTIVALNRRNLGFAL